MPSEAEQIDAVLHWNVFQWALGHLPAGKSIDDVTFPDLITVTEDQVLEHVREHGFPTTVVAEREHVRGADERLCIEHLEDGRWAVFYSERGLRSNETRHTSYADAQRFVVAELYRSARTALNHRWWHAHPGERPPRITDMP